MSTSNINKKIVLIVSSILVIFLIVASVFFLREYSMNKCVKTYSAEWNLVLVKKFHLTKEDMCEAGYSLSGFLLLQEDIGRQVVEDEKKLNQNFYQAKNDPVKKEIIVEKVEEEIDRRLQSKIRIEQKNKYFFW